jgi:hypothetical protein
MSRPAFLGSLLILVSVALVLASVVRPAPDASAQGTGSLVVHKDCLIVGPDGKVQNPPPPEGPFQLELSKGISAPSGYTPEAIIGTFSLNCGQTRTFTGLAAGTYNVFEVAGHPDFGQIANFCINVPVAAGQQSECLLTNEKLQTSKGAIAVYKDCLDFNSATQTFGNAAGQGSFGFELLKGESPLPAQRPPGPTPRGSFDLESEVGDFQLACGGFKTFSGLTPGMYSAFETSVSTGFAEYANFCVNVQVQPAQTAECRITNEKLQTATPAPSGGGVITPPSTGDAGLR